MRYFSCLLLFFFASCTVGPNYQVPDLNPGSGWSIQTDENIHLDLSEWWKQFNDPILNQLVERAVSQNLDIRQAIARVEEARALYTFTSGDKYPAVSASGSVTRRRQSENGPLPIDRIPDLERDQTIYDIGFDAVWEIDIFGGTRRAIEAADARFNEALELRHDLQISVIAEVVRRYIELRTAQSELLIRKELVDIAQQTYDLVLSQLNYGEVTESRLTQADTALKLQQAEIPSVQAEIQTASLALGLLLGDFPESMLSLTDQKVPIISLKPVPVGMRADLLRRRPDIRAAEHRLAAATADIGNITAELFPKLTLSGAGGFEALSSGNLLEASSQTWLIAPIISWRVFEGGRIRAQIHAQEAITKRLALAYEESVLTALNEAEQALTRYHFGLESLKRQQQTIDAAELNYRYAQSRYNQGDISLFELLDAQESVFTARTTNIRVHRQTATHLVALYKAMGGGWQFEHTHDTKQTVSANIKPR